MQKFDFDFDEYKKLLQAVGSMSGLFSDNDSPYIDSRFVEKLYIYSSKARDLTREDKSFDAIIKDDIGVGIKTFTTSSLKSSKSEKVAEFAKDATSGAFINLNLEEIAYKSSVLRNKRVQSDANEYGVDLEKSIYHCLIRTPGLAMVHEEPYPLININSIKPTDKQGKLINKFKKTGHSYFTDGSANYSYNISKNVLFKRFDLMKFDNSPHIKIKIYNDIFSRILNWMKTDLTVTKQKQKVKKFVVLPLYGYKNGNKFLFPGSGLNQWNAGGRKRKFGEAYISVPAIIHKKFPGFFPKKDQKFKLVLPNNKKISAKICQQNDKALMSDPNEDLCDWLYTMIDGSLTNSKKRQKTKNIFTYSDLSSIGKDSVKITKISAKQFHLSTMPIDSYEEFINDELIEDKDD